MSMRFFRKMLISSLLICTSAAMLLAVTGCDNGKEGEDGTEGNATTVAPETNPVTVPVTDPVDDGVSAADFTVSNVFGNHMILQRGEHIRVWGWAEEAENGKLVYGEFMGHKASAVIADGAWEMIFEVCLDASAEEGNDMKIYTSAKEVLFQNVLVGDVYMVIGQSNVAYSVAEHQLHAPEEKGGHTTLNYDAPIRLFYNSLGQTAGYPTRGTEEICEQVASNSRWKKASLSQVRSFSAIGYYFACHYLAKSGGNVPVGLIEIDGNGLPIGTFMPNEVANRLGTDTFDEAQGIYTTVGVNAGAGRYMYNHYMAPFERYPLAGVIWYQGESDCFPEHAVNYPEKFAALMTYMRGTHNLVNPDFPVYYVEFPSIYTQPEGFTPSDNAPIWAYMETGIIRASMGRIPRVLENSYQIVSSDLWNDRTFWNNLHPNCKYEQAERIAETVLAVLGEQGTLDECAGPKVVDYAFAEDGKSVVLTYDYVGDGLTTSDGGTAVRGFWAVGDYLIPDGVQILSAEITAKNQVTVICDNVITALVYHNVGTNYYGDEINLCSSYGVPAGATAVLP